MKKRNVLSAVIGGIVAPILVLAWSVVRYNQIYAQMGDGPDFAVVEVAILQRIVAPIAIPVGAIVGVIIVQLAGVNKRNSV
jgi:hypothetical protein